MDVEKGAAIALGSVTPIVLKLSLTFETLALTLAIFALSCSKVVFIFPNSLEVSETVAWALVNFVKASVVFVLMLAIKLSKLLVLFDDRLYVVLNPLISLSTWVKFMLETFPIKSNTLNLSFKDPAFPLMLSLFATIAFSVLSLPDNSVFPSLILLTSVSVNCRLSSPCSLANFFDKLSIIV